MLKNKMMLAVRY